MGGVARKGGGEGGGRMGMREDRAFLLGKVSRRTTLELLKLYNTFSHLIESFTIPLLLQTFLSHAFPF